MAIAALINIFQKYGEYLPVPLLPRYEFPLDKTLIQPDKLRLQSAFVHELKHYYQFSATTWGAHFTFGMHNSNAMAANILKDAVVPYFQARGQRVPVPLMNALSGEASPSDKDDLVNLIQPYVDFMLELYFDCGVVEKIKDWQTGAVLELPQVTLGQRLIPFGTLHIIEGSARIEDKIRRYDKPDYYGSSLRYDFLLEYVKKWQLPAPELTALICSDIALNPPLNITGASRKPEQFYDVSPPSRFIIAMNACHELLEEGRFPFFDKPTHLQWLRTEIETFYSQLVSLICQKTSWDSPRSSYGALFIGDLQYLTQNQIEFYKGLLNPSKLLRKTYPSSIAVTTICEDFSELSEISMPPALVFKDETGLPRFLPLLHDKVIGYSLDFHFLLESIVSQLLYGRGLCEKRHFRCPLCGRCNCHSPKLSVLEQSFHTDECSFVFHFENDVDIKGLDLDIFEFPVTG